ncbi:hypothetical protein BDY19DRAFT_904403 [Irpex rosettiformis]|uniref:Uncharacterized protein n=1 Tax=Irpex rosettiformis TaxID=378272 RepID=A0ACB8UBW0_9APHY|nr:hypothetical protein BDY19DRAFT_904403 [Irpex rosettiformis]
MPSTTSYSQHNNADLMSVESRKAARDALVEIFWIYQKIESDEVDIAKAHGTPDNRIVSARQGGGYYLLHVMFFPRDTRDTVPTCGVPGDVWIAEPQIYVRTSVEWTVATVEASNTTKHPFLDRHLALHPLHFSLQWSIKSTTRQHRGKWKQDNIEQNSHPGVRELVQRTDLKAIIATRYQALSSEQISHYLSIILPCFLDNQEMDRPVDTSHSLSATTFTQPISPEDVILNPQIEDDQELSLDQDPTQTETSETRDQISQLTTVSVTATDCFMVRHSAQATYNCFSQDTYAGKVDADPVIRQYRFFNEAIIGATPKLNTAGVSKELLEADEKLVEWMSTGQDATASSCVNGEQKLPIVQVFDYSTHLSLPEKMTLSEKIHNVLASGRAVALVPTTPDPELEWLAENIGYLLTGTSGDCSTVVNWQSTHKRHIEHQKHRNPKEKSYWIDLCQKGTMEEFLAVVKAQDEPVNCLDAPQAAGYAPDIINLIANNCHAWNATNSIGYASVLPSTTKTHVKVKKTKTVVEEEKAKKGKDTVNDLSELSDLSPLTSDEEFEGKKGGTRCKEQEHGKSKDSKNSSEFQYLGVRGEGAIMVERDVDRMRRWMLLGSSQFYTYPHHDAAGLVTWTCLLNGLKIWSYILPKEQPKNMEHASKIYTEIIQSLHHIGIDTENRLPAIATAHNLFLAPSTLLIQPPGLIHQVLTVKNSVTREGHLLTWNTMHLTEWTRKLSHNCFRVGTNDLHPGVQRTLGRMMIAISFKGPTKRDYESNDKSKIPGYLKQPSRNAKTSQKETWNEHVEAVNIAKFILH